MNAYYIFILDRTKLACLIDKNSEKGRVRLFKILSYHMVLWREDTRNSCSYGNRRPNAGIQIRTLREEAWCENIKYEAVGTADQTQVSTLACLFFVIFSGN